MLVYADNDREVRFVIKLIETYHALEAYQRLVTLLVS